MKKAIVAVCCALFLWGCSVRKPEPRILVLPPPPPIPMMHACEFKEGSFEGILPCFGNDCSESGPALTTFKFQTKDRVVRIVEQESGARDSVIGQWKMDENCILTLNFENQVLRFFRFHKAIEKIELLNDAQQSFNGKLREHCFISRIN
jgi:hypothetical protein